MKFPRVSGWLLFVTGILSLLCLVGFWATLHDISHDYVSPEVLAAHTDLSPGTLPAWTECPLEWKWSGLFFFPVLLFQILAVWKMFPGNRVSS
jgi:hypothetical protein